MRQVHHSVGEDARLLAAEAGGPQFIFESPSKHKSDEYEPSVQSAAGRSSLGVLLNRRLATWCRRLGPTVAVWLTAALVCAVYLTFERAPAPSAAAGLAPTRGPTGDIVAAAGGGAAGGDKAAFVDLGDGLSKAQASFKTTTAGAGGTAAAAGGNADPGYLSSYVPDLTAYLPDLSGISNSTSSVYDSVVGAATAPAAAPEQWSSQQPTVGGRGVR